MKKKWYCYICGKQVLRQYCLVSTCEITDRVFICCEKEFCQEQISDGVIIKIKEINV